jgi:hypothetical protein
MHEYDVFCESFSQSPIGHSVPAVFDDYYLASPALDVRQHLNEKLSVV